VQEEQIQLAIVIPTYNERGNVSELIERLCYVLDGICWEAIFVDDDSPDGTAELVRSYARQDRRIRLLHRVGRRGLSSACIEGMMATPAACIAVMDGDLQHDESILPEMFQRLCREGLDVVVATRNSEGGSMGDFARHRVWFSRIGQRVSNMVCRCQVSDPMSGFFMVRRSFLLSVVERLQGGGFKILVDMLSSSRQSVRLGEVGYCFRARRNGSSKLDFNAAVEYGFLVINKLLGGNVPARFGMFAFVGGVGVLVHLFFLALFFCGLGLHFASAQVMATYVAMTANFFLHNLITFRDRRLRGWRMGVGLISFWLACSIGALANVSFAQNLLSMRIPWLLAGIAGLFISAVWNATVNSFFTWQRPKLRPQLPVPSEEVESVDEDLCQTVAD
jgi:dolichol-phosphate mannosyltransferase